MRVLVDTNILLLHAAGQVDPRLLPRVTLGKLADSAEEFDRVASLLTQLRLHTTLLPLGELSALVEARLGLRGEALARFILHYRETLHKLRVVETRLEELLGSEALRWGVTDCSLFEAARATGWPLLTADDALAGYARSRGVAVFPLYDVLFAA